MGFNDLYRKMMVQLSRYGEDDDEEASPLDVKCIYCTREVRVSNFTQLRRGDHIKMKGENFRFNVGNKQVGPYTHHAIVKRVAEIQESTAELTLIEFISTAFDSEITIRETRKIINLSYEDIHIIRYKHKTHSADEIIKRAETFVEQCQNAKPSLKYSLVVCNCEHFCNWCCTGNEESYQVIDYVEALKNVLAGTANVGGKILRVALRLAFNAVDDIAKVSAQTLLYLPWGVLSIFGLIYLIYCIYNHRRLNKQKEQGNICQSCCKQQKRDMWLKFAVYAITNAGGLGLMAIIMTVFASKGVAIAGLVLVSILSVGSMWLIPKLRNVLCSPFKGRKVKVQSMNNIWQGDIVSLKYHGFMHDAVVTKAFPDKNDDKKGKIVIVHYSKSSVFGRRKIIEEEMQIDLGKKAILGHVYEHYKCHDPEIVVERARKRIGETKFGALSNRSCHFCHWAKVVQDEDCTEEEIVHDRIEYLYARELSPLESFTRLQSLEVDHRPGRKHATKDLGKDWAKIRDDVKPGQLIKFKMHWRWHSAVVTDVQYSMEKLSQLYVRVVHYGERREVTEDVYSFDLNEVDIWIYKYHPLYRYSSQDVVRRARARVGEKKYNAFTHNSSHLCKEIVEKQRDSLIEDFEDIRPGEAIIFYYWALKHAAIVIDVKPDESKANKSGKVTIVHYALPELFATRRISRETLHMDLNQDHIYKMNFEGCIRYPQSMIIKRANSRIGEKRFFVFGNTSWDFVHWASVVQSPVIVERVVKQSFTRQEASPNAMEQDKVQQRLLLPKVHNPSGKFQKVSVMAWMDIQIGDIVEYSYYWIPHQGIVSEKNEERKEMNVIHYGASHIFAVRTIMEDTLHVNLTRDTLMVYRTDPRNCYKRREIVERARRRLGEQDWRAGNRSWDMCLACVFKMGRARSNSK